MSRYLLHRDTYYGVVDSGVVFLDARRCAYLAIDSAHVPQISKHILGWSAPNPDTAAHAPSNSPPPPALIGELLRRGLLTASPQDGKPAIAVSSLTRRSMPATSYRVAAPRCHAREVLQFLRAATRVTYHLKRRDLASLLWRLERAKTALPGASEQATPDASVLMRKFERLRIWAYSAEQACLRDSLVLAEFLLRCGCTPTFVIGVRTRPFAAHAWVQSGDMVLNDSAENVLRYTAILAV